VNEPVAEQTKPGFRSERYVFMVEETTYLKIIPRGDKRVSVGLEPPVTVEKSYAVYARTFRGAQRMLKRYLDTLPGKCVVREWHPAGGVREDGTMEFGAYDGRLVQDGAPARETRKG
jgi:hypothetical protein